MMLARFFFLLVLTGGNAFGLEEPHDDHQMYNQLFAESSGGTPSGLGDGDNHSHTSSEEMLGGDPFDLHRELIDLTNNQPISTSTMGGIDVYVWDDFSYWDMSYNTREFEVDMNEDCSYLAVLDHLKITNSSKFTVSRPVKSHHNRTWVYLDVTLHAILDVRETDQSFISYSWIYLRWDNHYIWWHPKDFCDIEHVIVPTELLWAPDLAIQEMTEKDKTPTSPYYRIQHHGWVEYSYNQLLVTTCKMHVYKFPFDTQSCNISFKSTMHSNKEIQLYYNRNNSVIAEESRKAMQTQYEWLFLNMTVVRETVNHLGINQTMIVYTITMRRRSVLYIANFLLPIFFFLCLDLSSFLISEKGGEKLSFKVTVLLAVTVMQLILNEILPCSSNRIPLIAVYCIGIFGLMLLSLLETIVVMHLMEKDNETSEDKEMKKDNQHASIYVSSDEKPSVAKEGSSTQLLKALEKVSGELGDIEKTMTLLNCKEEEEKSGYWTRLTKRINRIFVIFYVTAVSVFLTTLFLLWSNSDDD